MNAQEKIRHTRVGVELVRRLVAEGDRIFTTDRARELSSGVGIKDAYLLQALHYLRRNGWIIGLRRGLYAISSSAPGVMPAHEFEVAMALVSPAAISHWSALHYHGLTDQIPRKVFLLTTTEVAVPRVRKISKKRANGYRVGDTVYQFVQVKPERYFGTQEVWVGETRVTITDPERTLLDGLSTPEYCGDLAEVFHAFQVRGDALNVDRIIEYALKLDVATAKRLGWVLEQQGGNVSTLERLASLPIKGYRRLDSSGPQKGPYNRRWMIQENLPGKIAA